MATKHSHCKPTSPDPSFTVSSLIVCSYTRFIAQPLLHPTTPPKLSSISSITPHSLNLLLKLSPQSPEIQYILDLLLFPLITLLTLATHSLFAPPVHSVHSTLGRLCPAYILPSPKQISLSPAIKGLEFGVRE